MKKLFFALFMSLVTVINANAQVAATDTVTLFTPCIDFNAVRQDVKDIMAKQGLTPRSDIANMLIYNDRTSKSMIHYTFWILDEKKLDNVTVTYDFANIDSQLKDLIDKVQKYYNVTLKKEGNIYSGIFNYGDQKTEICIIIEKVDDRYMVNLGFGKPLSAQ